MDRYANFLMVRWLDWPSIAGWCLFDLDMVDCTTTCGAVPDTSLWMSLLLQGTPRTSLCIPQCQNGTEAKSGFTRVKPLFLQGYRVPALKSRSNFLTSQERPSGIMIIKSMSISQDYLRVVHIVSTLIDEDTKFVQDKIWGHPGFWGPTCPRSWK